MAENKSQLFIILDDKDKWHPYYPTDQVISAAEYLFDTQYQEIKKANIINLCMDSSYLSLGHYCSMIAEARGHKALPNIKTMNDLQDRDLYIGDLSYLNDKLDKVVAEAKIKNKKSFKILSIFGQCQTPAFKNICQSVFNTFPVPLISIQFKFKHNWQIDGLKIESIDSLNEDMEDLFADSIYKFSNKVWRRQKNRKNYICDLAVLITKGEALAPSDEKALDKFVRACKKLDVFCEFIEEKDIARINEFDGLFVRTTTSINNYTYKFVKQAEMEGLIVIDDSNSIIKCTNKIFISNNLNRKKIPTIPGRYISKNKPDLQRALIEEFGLPLVCKIPDGSFSLGVKMAKTQEELSDLLDEMFNYSSLILVQKFMQTQYDWRIGILDKKPLFACKYFMSQGHWQIYNHKKTANQRSFSGKNETVALHEVPKKVINTALNAANIVGDGLYGVDLKEDPQGNVYIVEINDNPNIDSGVEDKVEGEDLYLRIVTSFIERIKKSHEPA